MEIVSMKLTDREEIILIRVQAADKRIPGSSTVLKKQDETVKALVGYGFIELLNPEMNRLASLSDYKLTAKGMKFLNERQHCKQAKAL